MAFTPADIRNATNALFCTPNNQDVIGLLPDPESEVTTIVDGLLYERRFQLKNGSPVAVRLYTGLGDLSKELWLHEVRAMLRFSPLKHPALPRVHDGGTRQIAMGSESVHIGFLVVDRAGTSVSDPQTVARLRSRPLDVIRQLVPLVDALRVLRLAGLAHRNLSPETIETVGSVVESGAPLRFRLSKFELSSFEADLLRRSETELDWFASDYRQRFVAQPKSVLACSPVERLRALFPTGPLRTPPEHVTGDVFSLGVVAFTWLVGDLNADLLDETFPTNEDGSHGYRADRHVALLDWMDQQTRAKKELPPIIRDIVSWMIRENPGNRPTPWELLDKLSLHQEDVSRWYGNIVEGKPYLVVVKPDEFGRMQNWGWIGNDPSTAEGLTALQGFIQNDLHGGVLQHAPGGWAALRHTDNSEHRRADVVLHGKQGAYFAHFFEFRAPHEEHGAGVRLEQVLYIRQHLNLGTSLGRQYTRPKVSFRLPSVVVLPWNSPQVRPSSARLSPSWKPLVDSVRTEISVDTEQSAFTEALQFLLLYQQVEMDARQYAYTREGLAEGNEVTLTFDQNLDETRRFNRPLLNLFCESEERRPPFVDFFSSLEERGYRPIVKFKANRLGEPSFERSDSGQASVVRSEGTNRLRIRLEQSTVVPEHGWLEPDDDGLARVILARQKAACAELSERPTLLAQLISPQSLVQPGRSWRKAADAFSVAQLSSHTGGPVRAGRRRFPRIRGRRGRRVLRELLATTPFYALQGPPGTGKTTIAARAVRAALDRNPSLRILVSAQSHYALDNLGVSIMSCLEPERDILAVRIASEDAEETKVDASMRPFLPDQLKTQRIESIRARVLDHLARPGHSPGLRQLLIEWKDKLSNAEPEIIDRLRRGANLVFATCGTATERNVGLNAGLGSYDWVLIEEAAKAWPSELAIPLVRGDSWTLIGDHRQLQAYRRREVLSFLASCANGSESVQIHAKNADKYKKVFDLFKNLFAGLAREESDDTEFDDDSDLNNAPLTEESKITTRPVNRLNTQFRMARPIGQLVSLFYDEPLQPGPDVGGPHGLELFEPHSLVWVDTGEEMNHYCAPCWHNAGEVALIRELLKQTKPLAGFSSEGESVERLAILSPYRQQVDHLSTALGEIYRPCVKTIDSFQGREADVVIVSLVRRRGGHVGKTATKRLGHVISEHRTNVMLSRAKKLLVLVGDLEHFANDEAMDLPNAPTNPWPGVCAAVHRLGVVRKSRSFSQATEKA